MIRMWGYWVEGWMIGKCGWLFVIWLCCGGCDYLLTLFPWFGKNCVENGVGRGEGLMRVDDGE